MTPLRYTPEIETPEPDEQATIRGIIEGMTQSSRTVEKREHHAVRASHAKSSACTVGRLSVEPNLPPELAQGLFASGGEFDVAVRFAQGPGETLGDRVSTHRGVSVKVFGVAGEKLPGHEAQTQDFVLATGTTFPSGTASGFLRDGKMIGTATPLPEGFKSAVSAAMRGVNTVLNAFGTESAKADFFGHPFSHPLAEPYFSQAPLRYGDYVAKLGLFPVAPAQLALKDWTLDPHRDEDGFRHAAVDFFRGSEAVFELRVQLWTNAATQPIEDASVDWPTEDSPYRTVATLRLPAQEADSAARRRYFDDVMTFRPAHALALHRPLGSVMRARLQVYEALSNFRHAENGIAAENTASIDRIPA
ncbi:catalase family protein [Aureimonas sp. AU12]|uniref:catalase family protein n=1 Tax=Aureimonas sp. AU12 TaxID=1638161 RepID=UPI000782CCF8|nr:catalase family protein [Aureimonas sp. AU12]